MEQKQPSALRPPKSVSGGKRKLTAVLLIMLLALGATSCANEKWAIYRYTIRAYYLDGGNKVITMEGYCPPYVESWKGSYWIKTSFDCEKAACRYDLLHSEDITAEYYNAEIVSTRIYDGMTIHTIKEKGGAR